MVTKHTTGAKMSDTSKHKCFVAANKSMAPKNTEIDFAFTFTDQDVRPIIRTSKLDPAKRGRPFTLLASYCPFCGSALQKVSA